MGSGNSSSRSRHASHKRNRSISPFAIRLRRAPSVLVSDTLPDFVSCDKIQPLTPAARLTAFCAHYDPQQKVLAEKWRLRLLVNNAGQFNVEGEETDEGLERTFASNHIVRFRVEWPSRACHVVRWARESDVLVRN